MINIKYLISFIILLFFSTSVQSQNLYFYKSYEFFSRYKTPATHKDNNQPWASKFTTAPFMWTFTPRLNIVDFSKHTSISIGVPVSIAPLTYERTFDLIETIFTIPDGTRVGFLAFTPQLQFNFGMGATYYTDKYRGGYIAAGPSFIKNSLFTINQGTGKTAPSPFYSNYTLEAGYRYWSNVKIKPRIIYARFGFGREGSVSFLIGVGRFINY